MSQITKFAVLLLVLSVGAVALSGAYEQSESAYGVDDEQITLVESGAPVDEAAAAESFLNDVVVTNNGTTLVDGEDFRWNASTGELSRINGSSVSDGETVRIDYTYLATSAETETSNTALTALWAVFPVLLLAGGALAVVKLLG
mgnify:CR=1 FL=1